MSGIRVLTFLLLQALGFAVALPTAAQTNPTTPLIPRPEDLAPKPASPTSDPGNLPKPPGDQTPRELAKPEQDITLDVKAYAVSDDAPPELRAALPALTAAYIGPNRHYEDLANAAAEVTRYLQRELGYYLGYAYLPEQDPAGGVVRIAILEGRLDRVELKWSDDIPVHKDIVEGYLARLRPGAILTVRDVERVVFLLNDLRGLTAKFEVEAGSRPGTAVLVVTPKAEARWSGSVDADINGSRFLGSYRLSGLLGYNSPLGRGDALTVNALTSYDDGLHFGLVGYTLPLGTDGLKVGASASYLDYRLSGDEFSQGTRVDGHAIDATVYALYPVIRSRNLNLFSVGSADYKDYVDSQAGFSRERNVSSVTLGATGDFRDDLWKGGVSTFDANLSGGKVHYPDGRPPALTDAENYVKLGLSFNRLQNIIEGRLLGYVALRGQYAFNNLDSGEQFRLGGPDGLRAFAVGEGTGDTGALLSLELRVLPPDAWFGRIGRDMVLSAFIDAGTIRYRHDASGEGNAFVNDASYSDAGIGVAWVQPRQYAFRASLAAPISGDPKNDKRKVNPRLYAQFTKYF